MRILLASLSSTLVLAVGIAILLFFSGTSVEAASYTLTSTTPVTNWSDVLRWNGGTGSTYPGQSPGDTVTITLGGATMNIDVAIPNPVQLNVSTSMPFTIPGSSSLVLEASSTATSNNTITVNGGTLGVASTANLSTWAAPITLNSGTFNVAGAIGMSNGSVLTIAGGTVNGGGTITIPVSHSIAFSGSSGAMVLDNVIINNSGTASYTSSANTLSINNGAVFNNNSGASFNVQTNSAINSDNVGNPQLNNGGTFNVFTSYSPTVNVQFNNSSNVNLLDTGSPQTLTLAGGGTQTGTFSLTSNPNSIIAFNGAHSFTGFTWGASGNSTFEILGGTSTVNSNFTTPNFTQLGGTLAGSGVVTVSNTMTWSGGTQTGAGAVILNGPGSMNGTSTMTLDSGRTMTVNGGSLVYNPGAGGSLAFTNNSAITVGGGSFDLQSDTSITSDAASHIDIINGTLTKSTGSVTVVGSILNISGIGTIQPGAGAAISFGNGGAIGGTSVSINTSAIGSALEFSGGTTGINSGTSVTNGAFSITNGTLSINTPLTITTLKQSGGTLKGTQTLSTGVLNWTGGVMDGGGSGTGTCLIINTGNINGGATEVRNHFTLTNGGTVHYQPASPLGVNQGGLIQNNGTWNLENGTAMTSDLGTFITQPNFNNASTLSKTIIGTTSFGVPFSSTGSVTLNNGADIEFTGGGTVSGAITFNNSGDIVGIQTNALTIPASPSITFTGPGFLRVGNTGTLINSGNTTLQNFELDNGGTLSGSGTLNITAGLKSTGGFLTGGGITNLGSSATGDLTSLAGQFKLNIHTFNNAGTINYNPTLPIAFAGSASFVNQSTGILNITGAGGTSSSGTANSFVNQGTINRSGSPTFFSFDLPFTNSGTVDAQSANNFVEFLNGGTMTAGTMKGSVGSAGIEFAGGTFGVTGGAWGTVGGVKITGGVLNIDAAMTAPAGFALVGGTLGTTTTGSLSMNSGSTFVASGGTVSNIQLIANTGGAVNFDTTSTSVTVDGATIGYNSGGFGQWIGGNQLMMQNGASISDGGTVTWAATGNVAAGVGATPTITVNPGGTLQKTTSASPIGVAANLQNSGGLLSSQAGALQLNYTGTSNHSGSFDAASGAMIVFGGTGGTNNFSAIGAAGAGLMNFLGGTASFTGSNTFTNLQLAGATMNGAGSITFSGTFDWSGGTLAVSTTNSGGTLNLDGTVSQMDLGANLSSGANFSSLSNAFAIGSGATYTNNGTFTITGNAPVNGLGTFTSSGTVNKSSAGASLILCAFNNNGTVNVNNGTLAINSSGTDAGSYASAGGTTLSFTGGTRSMTAAGSIGSGAAGTTAFSNTFTTGGTFTPSGPVSLTAGTLTLNTPATATMNGLAFTGGALSGTGAVQLTGTNTWTGGTLSGSGSFTLNSGATLSFPGGTGAIINGRTLTNAGTITANGVLQSLDLQTGASIVNQASGIIDLAGSFSLSNSSGTATFSNAGLFKKTCCAADTSSVAPAFTNTGNVDAIGGTLDFTSFTQSAGTTKLAGGAYSSAAAMNFTGGSLAGAGSINAALTNSGATIDPGDPVTPGAITVNGTFNQTAGALVTDLFANNSNDQLLVPSNSATVAGNLNVQLAGGYVPANGDSFTLINAGTLTDSTTKNYPAFGPNNTGFFTPTTTATTLSLAAVIPQADVDVSAATAPSTVVHNNSWTVTIPVTNNGPAGATGVALTVTPANGTLTGLTSTQGSCVGNSCSIGTLANGATATVTASITATTLTSVSATASVTANESDPVAANNSKTVNATVTPQADLALLITDSPDPVNAGGAIAYTYKVTNNGPDAASFSVGAAITNGTISSAPGCTSTATTATCSGTSLASGGNISFSITVTAPGAGPVTASGTVAPTNATDQTPANDSATQSTTVTPQADLQIAKSGPASSSAGSNISYTITVTNNGPSDAANVQVSDTPGAGLTFVGNSGACTGAFPCNIGTVTNGSSATIIATYTTSPSSTATSVTNSASVTSPTADPNGTNNSSTATTSLGPSADIAVSVNGPSTASPGSNFVLTVKVQNNGPSAASGITLSATNSPSISFQSNTGACTSAYPCALGTLNPGQFVLINTTYNADAGGTTGTATFTAAAAQADPNSANNSASHTVTTSCPSSAPSQLVPFSGQTNVPASGTLMWNDVGASSYNVYLGPAGSGCSTFYGSRGMTFTRDTSLTYLLDPGTTYEWAVEAVTPNCPTKKSACVTFTTATNCNAAAPQPVSPVNTTVSSPVTFTWTASNGATLYTVKNAADDSTLGTSTTTSLPNIVIPDGPFTWYVAADVPQCGQLRSANATFNGCSLPAAPIVGAVAESQSGQTYSVQWDRLFGVDVYELVEATNAAFTDGTVTTIPQPASGNITVPFTKSTTQGALTFFYKVRARSICNQGFGPYSTDIRVVVLPPPPKTQKNPSVTVPVGSTLIVVQQVFVPGLNDGIVHTFTASVDKPWLTVEPASGILPAEGVTLDVKANPANLPNGTETGTVIVTINTPSSGKTGTNGSTVVTVPVSVNLVTPVIPSTKTLPPDNTLIIPSVGHLDGLNSHWQSDIRLANTGTQKLQYALKFTPADPSAGGVKTTTIDVDGGATTALDDIVRNWYGIGSVGDSANGVLEVRPLTPSSKTGSDATAPSVSKVTVVSSRTYTTGDNGTLGQFIPAIPFSAFIGKASQQAQAAVLSLQQISQSSQYRTNVGIVEGSGQPANVLLSIFDPSGNKLKDVPVSLKAGQQLQIPSLLASVGIPNLADGRIEVKVTSGEGRVTAYASVVDNLSTDPLLVNGVRLAGASADNYVVPGVADINTGAANWRTDMRIFNGAASAQNATVTFFRQGESPLSQSIVINAGEIRTLDSIVQTLFGVTNSGGAVHVTTNGNSNLIVSGRTYNATSNGTFGQFIPAVTAADSIAAGDRPLQILQAEESVRYRTNIGVAEVTGKPVGVDVFVNIPDTKVTPVFHVDLAANDFQQFNVFRALGMENVYNARVSIRVTDGDGRVTAYGSVVDQLTSDPTYVPAQQ